MDPSQLTGRLNPAALYARPGLREVAPESVSREQSNLERGIDQFVRARQNRIEELRSVGDQYWLHVDLTIGSTPVAGTRFTFTCDAIPFDLLLVGAHSNLRLSRIEVQEKSRTRSMMNAGVLLSAFATFSVASLTMDRATWFKHYFLPANSQLQVVIIADGTESSGYIDFEALQPPTYYS